MSLTSQQLKDAAKYFGYEDADLPDWDKDGMWTEVKADVVYQLDGTEARQADYFNDTPVPKFKIVFTNSNGDVQTEWKGYYNTADCRSALKDADLIIPHNWYWTIKADK
tara:strand:+ start:2717 stop:3043 length:327 start_codon:yes stop_codon:yes gene_type:complete